MIKLFISQPMHDKQDEEILAVRKQAIESVKRNLGEDVEVIDSFFQNAPHDTNPLWYLAKSIELMGTADVVSSQRAGRNTGVAVSRTNVLVNTG